MSPSLRTFSPGIPCTISLFTETQRLAGKPRYPLKEDSAPSRFISFSAMTSSSLVFIPGLIRSLNIFNTVATILPACRMAAISLADFTSIPMRCHPLAQRGHDSLVHSGRVALAVYLQQLARPLVVGDERGCLREIDLQPFFHRLGLIIGPLAELAATAVALAPYLTGRTALVV